MAHILPILPAAYHNLQESNEYQVAWCLPFASFEFFKGRNLAPIEIFKYLHTWMQKPFVCLVSNLSWKKKSFMEVFVFFFFFASWCGAVIMTVGCLILTFDNVSTFFSIFYQASSSSFFFCVEKKPWRNKQSFSHNICFIETMPSFLYFFFHKNLISFLLFDLANDNWCDRQARSFVWMKHLMKDTDIKLFFTWKSSF